MTAPRRALIVGASRGIGLALAGELATRGWRVVATQRTRSEPLHRLAAQQHDGIRVASADVTQPQTIAALAETLAGAALDVVLLNAGIYDGCRIDEAGDAAIAHAVLTNAAGPARAARALLPVLRDGGVLAFTTSRMGSIALSSGGADLYRMSKAALNMLSRNVFEEQAKARAIAVLSLHPGWVRTDMGGDKAPLSAGDSARALADLLDAPHPVAHRFLDHRGNELPW
ncbi:SDR family NAD(P)-dependent oxidoreductase [Erythrobacteraceae bacterium CFH 75059]|uniref:SDR family NAD(P)-dependent oxidoreductase n=1 Tax=Qipengyuania thermophila TaxID=2509361 RepID=UPI00101E8707|nr:SDR family NAD(P)-dependent oxidoreductase [Qipengyuania thermophila]TCD06872.1 SDR family NAD(P)-dependent oxidoreductase [Erythrobacteraceae bacterium CFH 75059]